MWRQIGCEGGLVMPVPMLSIRLLDMAEEDGGTYVGGGGAGVRIRS